MTSLSTVTVWRWLRKFYMREEEEVREVEEVIEDGVEEDTCVIDAESMGDRVEHVEERLEAREVESKDLEEQEEVETKRVEKVDEAEEETGEQTVTSTVDFTMEDNLDYEPEETEEDDAEEEKVLAKQNTKSEYCKNQEIGEKVEEGRKVLDEKRKRSNRQEIGKEQDKTKEKVKMEEQKQVKIKEQKQVKMKEQKQEKMKEQEQVVKDKEKEVEKAAAAREVTKEEAKAASAARRSCSHRRAGCTEHFADNALLHAHARTCKFAPDRANTFPCTEPGCRKRYYYLEDYQRHQARHGTPDQAARYQCRLCPATSHSCKDMVRHSITAHSKHTTTTTKTSVTSTKTSTRVNKLQ